MVTAASPGMFFLNCSFEESFDVDRQSQFINSLVAGDRSSKSNTLRVMNVKIATNLSIVVMWLRYHTIRLLDVHCCWDHGTLVAAKSNSKHSPLICAAEIHENHRIFLLQSSLKGTNFLMSYLFSETADMNSGQFIPFFSISSSSLIRY